MSDFIDYPWMTPTAAGVYTLKEEMPMSLWIDVINFNMELAGGAAGSDFKLDVTDGVGTNLAISIMTVTDGLYVSGGATINGLLIANNGASITGAASIDDLTVNTTLTIPASSIGPSELATDSVTSVKILNDAVTGVKILNGAVSFNKLTGVNDEDDMVSDSDTALASQQSIKAYVDGEITILATTNATETLKGVAEIATQTEVDTGTDDERFVTPLKLSANKIKNYLHVRDEKSSGEYGGTFTKDIWQTRTLNTMKENTIDGASPAKGATVSDQFTLPAGAYRIMASAPALYVNHHAALLYNVTDASNEIIGTSEATNDSGVKITRSFVTGQFEIASTKVFELRHQCETTRDDLGFGDGCGFGVVEVYTDVEIWKVA